MREGSSKGPDPQARVVLIHGKRPCDSPDTGSFNTGTDKILCSSSPSLDSFSSSCLLHFRRHFHKHSHKTLDPSASDTVLGSVPLSFARFVYSQC